MSPLQTLSRLLKVDPKTGTFILTGLALLAAAAMALAFGSNIDDAVVLAVYILVFALAVTVLTFISRQEVMRTTLSWIAIVAFGGWVAGLFGSVLRVPPTLPQLPCYIRLPVELPAVCEARLTTTTRVIGSADNAWLMPQIMDGSDGPERIWTVQDPDSPPPAGLTVVVQFTNAVQRDATIALTTSLTRLGWVISDGTAGGEQVSSGPDQNEVRYFRPEDSAAAIQLAEAIYAQNPNAPIAVRDFTRLGSYAQTGLLEVWLSSLTPGISG
jgi:hypothetical protein